MISFALSDYRVRRFLDAGSAASSMPGPPLGLAPSPRCRAGRVRSVWCVVAFLVLFIGIASSFANTQGPCNDGIDNDNDGLIDHPLDPDCASPTDLDEANPACSDGIDNDKDGRIDHPFDPDCASPTDLDEANPACSDGIDNDRDGLIDHPLDPDCASPTDLDEANPVCSDGIDNDNDGLIDHPLDPGCASPTDLDETNPACNDGIDNDNDGLIDHPLDPGCASPTDLDETNPIPTVACNDGIDNDNDGLIDHPLDPGCASPTDPNESNSRSTQCSDGMDNDADGETDYPADAGCISHSDNDERGDSSCRLSRKIELQRALTVSQSLAPDAFEVSSCGLNCLEYRMGKLGDDYLSGGINCGSTQNTATFTVNRPDLIQSVTFTEVNFDDYTSIRLDNQLVWSEPAGWMGGANQGPRCSENQDRGRFTKNIDVTSAFTSMTPGGTLRWDQTTYYRELGSGWSKFRFHFNPLCDVRESISGDCSSLDGDSECALWKEVVDGVTTWDQGRATGRLSSPFGKSFASTDGGCTRFITHPWWEKTRTYRCRTDANLPACADGDDNDGDGSWDYPNDDGCGSYGDTSEDSTGVCFHTGGCVCGSDVNADGAIDFRSDSELAICQDLSGRLVCPTGRQRCRQQLFDVWNPSGNNGLGSVENRQGWVCPAGVEYGCGRDPSDGHFYCSSRPCVNAASPVVAERHDSAGEWLEDRPGNIRPDGTCDGEFQIFSGSARRCQKRGIDTAYQNCCKNRLPPLSDRTGAPGEPTQREYREQHTRFEFWKNQCDPEDQESALLNDSMYCISLGTYCAKEWAFLGCVQRHQSFCCYNSRLAALVHKQLKTTSDFGDLRRPNCRGFTPEAFQTMDLSKLDLSSYFDSIERNIDNKNDQNTQNELRTKARNAASGP